MNDGTYSIVVKDTNLNLRLVWKLLLLFTALVVVIFSGYLYDVTRGTRVIIWIVGAFAEMAPPVRVVAVFLLPILCLVWVFATSFKQWKIEITGEQIKIFSKGGFSKPILIPRKNLVSIQHWVVNLKKFALTGGTRMIITFFYNPKKNFTFQLNTVVGKDFLEKLNAFGLPSQEQTELAGQLRTNYDRALRIVGIGFAILFVLFFIVLVARFFYSLLLQL